MNGHEFEWDDRKNQLNQRKHGIAFDHAREVFDDRDALELLDDRDVYLGPDGEPEERINIIGLDAQARVIFVCYTWRGGRRRIIMARRATNPEIRTYDENRFHGGR